MDALSARVLEQLSFWTAWVKDGGVQGQVGEFGWPTHRGNDTNQWNSLGSKYLSQLGRSGVSGLQWAAGRWGFENNLVVFKARGNDLDQTLPGGRPLRTVLSECSDAGVGVNLFGAEFGVTDSFSSANPGAHGVDYTYPSANDLAFLAHVGVRVVRLPFRWERMQPTLGKALRVGEINRLRRSVARAARLGIRVIVEPHNFASYIEGSGGERLIRRLGPADSNLNADHLSDLWSRLARALRDVREVVAFDLMNEPTDMEPGELVVLSNPLSGASALNPSWNGGLSLGSSGSSSDASFYPVDGHHRGPDLASITLRGSLLSLWCFNPASTDLRCTLSLEGNGKRVQYGPPASVPSGRWRRVMWRMPDNLKPAGQHGAIGLLSAGPVIIGRLEVCEQEPPERVWESISQAVVDALRDAGDEGDIYVPGYAYSSLIDWARLHPAPWVVDSQDRVIYTAHHYWDSDQSGRYSLQYADEAARVVTDRLVAGVGAGVVRWSSGTRHASDSGVG